MTSEAGTSKINMKVHREDGSQFYGSVPETPLLDEMGKLLDLCCSHRRFRLCLSKAVCMAKSPPITIPTEPIGSIPRPADLIERVLRGESEDPNLAALYEDAVQDTIQRFEATGSPVVTDGEHRKYHNFAMYCVHCLPNTAPDGFKIPFSNGHTRRPLWFTRGPFRYKHYADPCLDVAIRFTHVPVKQAVISPLALSLMYPAESIPDYSREQFRGR
jgi:methionine synthase II (cobalamin-independent)